MTHGQFPGHGIPGACIVTNDQAREIIGKAEGFGTDVSYHVTHNPNGTFTVIGRSRSIVQHGGSGTTGVYTVYPDGSYRIGDLDNKTCTLKGTPVPEGTPIDKSCWATP